MARQERQVDPADGPLQAFAYELRLIREKAGNPTYRTLAKAAGFSPTTLSEAASGRRKPSLDVVLAYVGACGGDIDAWRGKWQQLDQELAPTEREISEPPTPETQSLEQAQQQPRDKQQTPAKPAKRRWAQVATLTTIEIAAIVVLLAIALPTQTGNSHKSASVAIPAQKPACPHVGKNAAFTGITYENGAHVRAGATRDAPVVSELPGNCTIAFTGMCLGEVIHDRTGGTPDMRWFLLPNGVVSSAVIHGNPPPNPQVSRCKQDQPPPGSITLSVPPNTEKTGEITLEADGLNTAVIGFSVSSAADKAGQPWEWHQVGFIEKQGQPVRIHWTPSEHPEMGTIQQFVVVAGACSGGDGPTNVMDIKSVQLNGNHIEASRLSLNSDEYANAARTACRYPSRTTLINQSRSPG